jgi:hypothetical protein
VDAAKGVAKAVREVPFFDESLVKREANWDEYLGRAYLFWTPHRRLSLRADYRFERFDQG